MFDKLADAIREMPGWLAGQIREISGEAAEERRRLRLRVVEPSLTYAEARVQVELAVAEAKGRSVCTFEDAFDTFCLIMAAGHPSGRAIHYLRAGLMSGLVQGEKGGRAWAQLLATGWDRDLWRVLGSPFERGAPF